MTLDRIRLAKKRTIGTNQTTKALLQSIAKEIYVAKDADQHVIAPVISLAQEKGISVLWVESMKSLGKACGIEVGAATAAVVED
ncbi:50S ribosomal protein L7ae-like protein [Alicyclobacillaceae bacterium I2511]|jgi:large subunit ribosomal protein L7A|nr:50S ribosomal protein L7ae-like protein [Alicyclobacillaceae bacterium I2511]